MKTINWLKNFIKPKQNDENVRRQELILNILLVFSLLSFFIINIIRIIDHIIYTEERGLPLWSTLIIFIFFIFLLLLSRLGWIKTASVLLIITFSLPMFYSFIIWGADLPAALILAVLVITLSGILLGARLAFLSMFFISLILIVLTDWQARGLMRVENYWRQEQTQIGDAITYTVLFLIIAAVAWLFCREISRSLKRAQYSEKLLREERGIIKQKSQV